MADFFDHGWSTVGVLDLDRQDERSFSTDLYLNGGFGPYWAPSPWAWGAAWAWGAPFWGGWPYHHHHDDVILVDV